MTSSVAFYSVYLASQSPRRAQLLDQLGVRHHPLLPQADEDIERLEAVMEGEDPAHYVQRVTLAKLNAAVGRWARWKQREANHGGAGVATLPILAADTTVVLGRRVLGKPVDADDASRMLQSLAGRSHRVMTAVAVAVPSSTQRQPKVLSALSVSRVHVAKLSARDISHYVATHEPFGKAGAYAIQGRFARFVTCIDGSHSGIMGLPLHETSVLLKRVGVVFY